MNALLVWSLILVLWAQQARSRQALSTLIVALALLPLTFGAWVPLSHYLFVIAPWPPLLWAWALLPWGVRAMERAAQCPPWDMRVAPPATASRWVRIRDTVRQEILQTRPRLQRAWAALNGGERWVWGSVGLWLLCTLVRGWPEGGRHTPDFLDHPLDLPQWIAAVGVQAVLLRQVWTHAPALPSAWQPEPPHRALAWAYRVLVGLIASLVGVLAWVSLSAAV